MRRHPIRSHRPGRHVWILLPRRTGPDRREKIPLRGRPWVCERCGLFALSRREPRHDGFDLHVTRSLDKLYDPIYPLEPWDTDCDSQILIQVIES